MPGNSSTLFGRLQAFWRWLAPDLHDAEPVVNVVDEWRTDFTWRGPPVTFDRRRNVVLRGGRVIAKYAEIQSIDVRYIRRNDDTPEFWRVSLATRAFFPELEIGTTRNDVEASIAASRLATVMGVKVRSL